jgi:hypothetical protein
LAVWWTAGCTCCSIRETKLMTNYICLHMIKFE